MAYCTTPHASTGESPFFILYGRDARIPSVLGFYSPRLTVDSEYGRELFSELKRIREIAKQKIKKAQHSQKIQYDKGVKDSRIRKGDIMTLRVNPKFKLDRSFHGPYQVHGVTSTSARIQPMNKPDDELICVSLQCLSCCTGLNLDLHGWVMGKLEDTVRWAVSSNQSASEDHDQRSSSQDASQNENEYSHTKSGQMVKKPQHYCWQHSFPDGSGIKRCH